MRHGSLNGQSRSKIPASASLKALTDNLPWTSTAGNAHQPIHLHFMRYSFARVHRSLGVSPAMEAGVAAHAWSIGGMVALLDSEAGSN